MNTGDSSDDVFGKAACVLSLMIAFFCVNIWSMNSLSHLCTEACSSCRIKKDACYLVLTGEGCQLFDAVWESSRILVLGKL